ncbi:MotA/TolQ/ExbB proton channel family protein [Hyphobacterium marinum]|uniref:MotA/TolQ/ExbB proton channel family protein n=1 Tax=Hyphobacterium marinum TaxID=3116574 RepID=A0ABU7M105_9PROT|nr:MotA/TolQ/ExbB proton channel family protein [Hyphobacterium sp. Y6023]MEE2567376.1 MotA/TolQ/ExbB proton channel family protein [Hyphobacterium sp. Y6023]
MKTTLKALAMAVGFGAMFAAGAAAQNAPASSINELLNRVRSDAREASQENQRRLQEFRNERNTQTARLGQVRGELAALQGRADQLEAQFASNQEEIDQLAEELRVAQGAFGELFGAARQTAGEFSALIGASVTSSQHPGRTAPLDELANSRTLPTRNELDQIWRSAIAEMIYQGEIATFNSNVVNLDSDGPVPVTRVGTFVAFATQGGNSNFLQWTTDENSNTGRYRLRLLPAQPPENLRSAATNLYQADWGEVVAGPVDPSRGALLEIYRDVPDLAERIEQGRIVGKIILGLLAVSALFGIYRLLMLVMTSSAVAAQKRRSTPSRSNPLGRVMLAYESVKDHNDEVIEMKLDEAILKETPKLEFGLNFLKLAAGIAPLLGLLGTVTGMIKTFTQITLFGTGDPKIMAGGISEALVTTVLGLVAAIPLLFIHSFAQSFARGVQQTLEEQAAGIVARHAEERAGGGNA